MPSYTLLHLFFTTGEVGINMFLSQEKKLRLTEVIQLARSGIVIRTSVYLGLSVGKSGSLGTVWLNQLPLLTDAPSGCQGPSDVLLMRGVSCLSSQGAACPAPSYVPMPCSGSWSSAGPTSPGSDPASAPSTRSCRASESDIGEAGPSLFSRPRPLSARLYFLPTSSSHRGKTLHGPGLRPLAYVLRVGTQLRVCCASLFLPGLSSGQK